MDAKVVLLIMDGLGGLPHPKTEKTELEYAKTPNMDKLVKEGMSGLMSTLGRGIIPGSDTAHLQLFGYDPKVYYHGRGPFEALGAGMKLKHGDIAFRANFATVDAKGSIVDRRAGRIATKDARKLEKYCSMKIGKVDFIFKHTVEHRGALIIRGYNGDETEDVLETLDTDPHKISVSPMLSDGNNIQKLIKKYSVLVHKRLSQAPENKNRELPANFVLLRGAGIHKEVDSIEKRFGLKSACVAGGALYKGVAKYVGMDVLDVPGATGDKHTDLNAKLNAALNALKTHDFVFLHVKATDSFGHDGDYYGKVKMIEKVDKEIVSKLRKNSIHIIITGDHSTPTVLKRHSGHPVPILIREIGGRKDKTNTFGENQCAQGGLGHIMGSDIINVILNMTGKAKKYGS